MCIIKDFSQHARIPPVATCPECSHTFPRLDNILPIIRPKICPRCGIRLVKKSSLFADTINVIGYLGYLFLFIAPAIHDEGHWKLPEWLVSNHWQLLSGWLGGWLFLLVVRVFFSGKFIRYRDPSLMTYPPRQPGLEFNPGCLIPIGFFVFLTGLVGLLIFIANKVAQLTTEAGIRP